MNYYVIKYYTNYSSGTLIIEKNYYSKKCKKIMAKLKDCDIKSIEEVTEEELE